MDWRLVALLVAVVGYQAFFWSKALRFEDGALVSSQLNIFGDWGMHLGDLTSFAWGENFPPTHPRLLGEPMAYHYLTSFTAAGMVTVGLHPVLAMTVQSFVMTTAIVLALYAFGRRVIGSRFGALLFVPIFLLGGGYGWIPLIDRLNLSSTDPFQFLHQQVFNRQFLRGLNYPLPNAEYMIQAQRGYLYGLPLALLALSLLLMAVRRIHERRAVTLATPPAGRWATIRDGRLAVDEARLFIGAGIAAGLIPIGHFSTVYALMLAMPTVAILSTVVWPPRSATRWLRVLVPLAIGWLVFALLWVALTVPQVLWVYGGEMRAASAVRLKPGWLAGDEGWMLFWLKNLGTLAILFPIALFSRGVLDGVTRRFLLGFSAIFVLCNVFAFLPWDWNNALFLQYWVLTVALFVSAWLARAWQRRRTDPIAHAALSMMVLSIIGLGLFIHVNHFTSDDRWVLLGSQGLELAEWIRDETPPDAVFATGMDYENPIAILSGRSVVVGYTTWLGTQGLDYAEHEHDLRLMMSFHPDTPALLAKHQVDYVAIGLWEREHLHANLVGYTQAYPIVYATQDWVVFAVSDRATARVDPDTATSVDEFEHVEAEGEPPAAIPAPPRSARSSQRATQSR